MAHTRQWSALLLWLWYQRRYFLISGLFLGLGLAMASMGFAIFYGFLLKPLPYPEVKRLVMIRQIVPALDLTGERASAQLEQLLKAHPDHRLQKMALVSGKLNSTIGLVNGVEQVLHYRQVSPDFFSFIKTTPYLGMWPSPAAALPDGPPDAVISYDFWQTAMNSNPNAVGSELSISGKVYQVTAVLPKSWHLEFAWANVYLPLVHPLPRMAEQNINNYLLGKLTPGYTADDLQPWLSNVVRDQVRQVPPEFRSQLKGYRVSAMPLREAILHTMHMRHLPWFYLGIGLFLWAIAVLNVANYALLRHQGALRNYAIRQMLGARSGQLVRLLLMEQAPSLLLALVLAIPLSILGLHWLSGTLFSSYTYSGFRPEYSLPIAVFLLGLLGLSALLIVALPMSRLRLSALRTALASDERTTSLSKPLRRIFLSLGTLQVALAIGLLSAALSLTMNGFVLAHRSLGFDPKGLYHTRVFMPAHLNTVNAWQSMDNALHHDLYVKTSAFAMQLPWEGSDNYATVRSPQRAGKIILDAVSPGFFTLLKIPLQRGSSMPDLSGHNSPALWLDSPACDAFFSSGRCVGQELTIENPLQISGVVAPITWNLLPDRGILGNAYLPLNSSWNHGSTSRMEGGQLLLHMPVDSEVARRSIATTLQRAIPGIVVENVESYADLLHNARESYLSFAAMLGLFAVLATGISMFGVYIVQETIQHARLPEYRIRRILGAQNQDVYKSVARGLLVVLIPGTIGGGGITLLLTHLVINQFPGAMAYIAPSIWIAVCLVAAAVCLASWVTLRPLLSAPV